MNNTKNINYNKEFICTYKSFEENYYSNLCYQIQLLQAFNMMHYDEYMLTKNIEQIFIYLRDHREIVVILELLLEKYKNTNFYILFKDEPIALFQLVFSHNYFDIFHKCFINYLNDESNLSDKTKNIEFFQDLRLFINNEKL